MASTWEKDLGIGAYGSKMRVRVDVVRQDRAGNYTRVRVRISAYNGGAFSRTYNMGSGAAVAVSGEVSRSGRQTFDIGPRSWATMADWEFNVSHGSNGRKSFSITGRLSDTGTSALGDGGSITLAGSFDPLYLAPPTPSWGATSYQSPSSVRVTWVDRSTARGTYDRVRVQRWARSTGQWIHRALLSGGSTSYTDTSLTSNEEHRWRVRAEGPGGTSGWVQGGTLGTTPAAATNVVAVKAEQGIRVSWRDNAAGTNRERTVYVDDNQDGNGWVRVGEIGGSATSWTHTDADPAVTHQYRVWVRIVSQIELTSSASDPSAVVQLQAAPKQPRRVGPADASTWEIGDALTLEWEHLPVDTTAQTAAEVQWRLDGGAWTLSTITGTGSTLDVTPAPTGARARLEWQVRTRGDHPDWSPWSTINGPLLSTRPQVLIQAPVHGEDLAVSRVEASWTYEPGGMESQLQQAEWKVLLLRYESGTPIENAAGSTETSAVLESRLLNRAEYAVQVSVRNGDGLWSVPDASVFTTDFPLPAVVESFPVWDQVAGAVSIGFGEQEQLRATYRWTGTPGASSSEAVDFDGNVIATNDVPNPIGPGAVDMSGWTTTDPSTLEEVDGEPAVLTLNGADNGSIYADPAARPSPPVGTRVRFSVEVMVTVPVDAFRLTISSYSGAASDGGSTGAVPLSPQDGWVRLTVETTVTAMPAGGYIRTLIWPLNDRFGNGEGFYFRRAIRTFDAPEGLPYFDGDTVGTTDSDAIDVERRQPDGSWLLIASGVDTGTTVVDRTPHIGDVQYRAISRTTLPTETEGPVAVAPWVHDRDPVFVNGGDGMDMVCLARGSSATDDHGVDQALHRFAGQASPTAFFGPGQSHSTSFTGRILPHYHLPTSARADWVELLRQRSLVCFRDCTGRKVYGVLTVSFSQTGNVEQVSIGVEEAAHVEGVRRVTDYELQQQEAL